MHTSSSTALPDRSGITAVPGLVLLLAYPFAVHFGALAGHTWLALLILSLLLWLPALLARRYRMAATGVGLLLLLGLLWWLTPLQALQVFYLPPMAIVVLLWWWFFRTLLPGQTALVSRLALTMHGGSMSPRLHSYTRGVTWLWVGVFSLLLLQLIWLSLFAEMALWSLFANFINYLIMLAVFALEFSMRRWLLPADERIDMWTFIRAIGRLRLHDLR